MHVVPRKAKDLEKNDEVPVDSELDICVAQCSRAADGSCVEVDCYCMAIGQYDPSTREDN